MTIPHIYVRLILEEDEFIYLVTHIKYTILVIKQK